VRVSAEKRLLSVLVRRALLWAAGIATLGVVAGIVLGIPSAISAVLLFGGARLPVGRCIE
jgi:hypothetical protein